MKDRLFKKRGFTLTEAMIASAIVALTTGGLFAAGIMLMKMSAYNRLSIEAQGWALSRIEEITGQGFDNIILQAPYPVQTNYVRNKYSVVHEVEIIGHAADKSVVSNLADSVYLEIHVDAHFISPFNWITNTVTLSTLVGEPEPE